MEIKQRFVLGAPAPLAATTGVDIAADNISATNVTTTNLAATNISAGGTTVTGTIDVTTFGAKGDGVADDTTAIANAWAAVSTKGGILFFPPGTYRTSGSLTPVNGSIIEGSGNPGISLITGWGTTIQYFGSGFWIDLQVLGQVWGFILRDLRVICQVPAIGAIRVASPANDLLNGLVRGNWNFSNLYLSGPGATASGTIGISLTQLYDHCISNLTVDGFERSAIIDRCFNGAWTRVRFTVFTYGPFISSKAGTGSASGGSGDVFTDPEFLGPTNGTGIGDTVTIANGGITCINALYEPEPGGVSKACIHITGANSTNGNGSDFRDIGGVLGGPAQTQATIICDDQFVSPIFIGTKAGISTFPPITFGTAYSGTTGDFTAKFIACGNFLNALVQAADNTGKKATIIGGPSAFDGYIVTQSANHDHTGTLRMRGVAGVGPANILSPLLGPAIHIFYWDPSTVDTGYIQCVDSTTNTPKNLTITAGYTVIQQGSTEVCRFSAAGLQLSVGVKPAFSNPGMQHLRIVTAPLPASSTSDVQINWSVAFADANYTAACILSDPAGGDSAHVLKIVSQTNLGILVRVINNEVVTLSVTLHAIAMHD